MSRLLAVFLLGSWFVAWPLLADSPSDHEIVKRILQLHREIEALLDQLPPAVRERVKARLAEEPSVPVASAPVAVDPPPEAPDQAPPAPPSARAEAEQPRLPVVPSSAPTTVRRRRPTCNTLVPFDTNDDGRLDSGDRYWRFFELWTDGNGDGVVQDKEVTSPFERGVRELALDLAGFEDKKSRFHGIRVDEHIVLDIKGNGFEDRAGGDDAVLVIDATALGRGDGLAILTSSGEVVEGIQPFRKGWQVRDAGGAVTVLSCP